MKHQLTCVVEYAPHNLAAYLREVDGIAVTGDTIEEIDANMRKAISMSIEAARDFNLELPKEFEGEWELSYQYDTRSFLNVYGGLLPKTAISRLSGINEKQLHHYASGLSKPSPKTVQKVAEGIRAFGRQLANTNFV